MSEKPWRRILVLGTDTMLPLLLGLVLFGIAGTTPVKESPSDIRIVGGDSIDITEAPYQVSVMHRGRHTCGGTIVNKDIVITAAHCVIGAKATDYQIRAGSSSSLEGGQVIPIGDMIWHPDFSYTEMDSDIAVLWLQWPLEASDAVKPVKMMDDGEAIPDGGITVVTGWGNIAEGGGYPSTLQRVEVPKVSELVCDKAYSAIYKISPRMLCAGDPDGGKDACQGDSGGPLIYNDKLAGVVSWGLGCARPDYPGVYAKVSALRKWVADNISFLRLKHIFRTQIRA